MDSDIIENTIKNFCFEFLQSPYLCYTEHGLHALFFCRLYSRIPENERYIIFDRKRVCTIQKEYPTASELGKSRRQHWDVAVLRSPAQPIPGKFPPYDYLRLYSVVELAMNCGEDHLEEDHLEEDVRRLSRPEACVENKFIIHLYRISESADREKVSERDLSPREKSIIKPSRVFQIIGSNDVTVYFGVVDSTNTHESGLWLINNRGAIKIG